MLNGIESDVAAVGRVHRLSLYETVDLLTGLISLVGTAIVTTLKAPLRGKSGAFTFGQHLSRTVMRKALRRFTTSQLQYVGKSFSQHYEAWCKGHGQSPASVKLESGNMAHWIGDGNKANYVMIYYHGGGFSLDGDHTHLSFWTNVRTELAAVNVDLAILFLEYTLVPHGTYPTQLSSAVESLNYVLTQLNRPASEVILAGDSAGGNLALGTLSQIMHPLDGLPNVNIDASDNLKALVLVAPWVSFDTKWPSVRRNQSKDLVSEYIGVKWSKEYLNGKPSDNYAEPGRAPAGWWKKARVDNLLAVAGEDEVLIDAVKDWISKYQSVNPKSTTFVAAPHESHIEPIINLAFGNTNPTAQGDAIVAWLKAKL